MVLGHSLRDKGAKGKLVAFVTVDSVSADAITELKVIFLDPQLSRLADIFRLCTMKLYLLIGS
jgi:hypothetical protein